MKGFSTVKLIVLLGLLVGVYMMVNIFTDKSRSKSFREELVEINSDEVSRIKITSSDGNVEVFKQDTTWKVKINDTKSVEARESAVTGFLSSLETIRPGAITTKRKEKWGDYQVDSTGTLVEVFEGDDKTLDIVIGRFTMSGRNSYATFVRLSKDNEVYTADNFMGAGLTRTNAGFRDTKLFQLNKDSIEQVTFNYPDSSFVLGKQNDKWWIGDSEADSIKVANYLSGIRYLSSNKFVDDLEFQFPQLTVDIVTNGTSYKVEAMESDRGWLIHTESNKEGFFIDKQLFEKVFKPKSEFLN